MLIIKIIATIVVIFGMGVLLYDSFKKFNSNSNVKDIKKSIKNGSYDWDSAIENTADRIIDNPESLLWR